MKSIQHITSIEAFETERLRAVKITPEDLGKFIEMHANEKVMATLGGIRSPETTRANLVWNLKQWTDNGFGLWMFYEKKSGAWVGRGGLRRMDTAGSTEVELAYALMPDFWGQGYATEIAQSCLEIGFITLRLNSIVSLTSPENKASQRVMQKAGFHFEKDTTMTYDGVDYSGVLYRIQNPRKPVIVPYDPNWPVIFAEEKARLQAALGEYVLTIHHIGSTAIPRMPAKPMIDILLEVEDIRKIQDIKDRLHPLGYIHFSRQVIPFRSFFTRRAENDIQFHIHLYERGDPQIKRHLYFKEYVSAHADDADRYAGLKKELAIQFKDDMKGYVTGKDRLVQEIDKKAKLWPMRPRDFLPANTGQNIRFWSAEDLHKAINANMNVHMTYYAQYLDQIELVRIPGYTLVNSGLGDDTFNVVLDASFSAAEASAKIDVIREYFADRAVAFSWWLSDLDQPADLGQILIDNGFIQTETNTTLYLDLDNWQMPADQPSPLKIIRANDEKSLRDFALVLCNNKAAFETYFKWIAGVLSAEDPIEFYVGYSDGKPVVRGLSCYYAGVAGFYFLSTTPAQRNKGFGRAMQHFRLNRAKELGYHIAVLQASSQAVSLNKKLGYVECGSVREYKIPGPARPL